MSTKEYKRLQMKKLKTSQLVKRYGHDSTISGDIIPNQYDSAKKRRSESTTPTKSIETKLKPENLARTVAKLFTINKQEHLKIYSNDTLQCANPNENKLADDLLKRYNFRNIIPDPNMKLNKVISRPIEKWNKNANVSQ